MQPIIYDVAVSTDGFIAGPSADVSALPHTGSIVDDYLARLTTYEFGVKHGVPPGANPHPNMRCIVVSSTLSLPGREVDIWRDLSDLAQLRATASAPIYLCGGGVLASAVAATGHLRDLALKRAPVVSGWGVPLFAGLAKPQVLSLLHQTDYGEGLLFQHARFS